MGSGKRFREKSAGKRPDFWAAWLLGAWTVLAAGAFLPQQAFAAQAKSAAVKEAGGSSEIVSAVSEAVGVTEASAAASTAAGTVKNQGAWVLINGKYYWQRANGTIRKKAGAFSTQKNTYYTNRDGSRVESAYRKINGKYYYFKANGKMYRPKTAQLRKLAGQTSYFYTDGHVAVGRTKIGSKYYYFDEKGALQTNQRVFELNGRYYSTDAKGVMTKMSETKAKCITAAWKYIDSHSDSSKTSLQRLRSCFNYLLAYMHYQHFSMDYSYSVLDKKEGLYELALYTLESDNLSGNCHNFASCIAVFARELGFTPTMVTMPGDHSFVIIDGGYYDNMYGGLFGASTRPAYTVYKSVTL